MALKKREQEILDSIWIVMDTREQNTHIQDWLLRKGKNVLVKKLDYGDYSYMIPKNESLGISEDVFMDKEIVIERKSGFEELINNICDNNGCRLEKELRDYQGYMTICIEDFYDKACLGEYSGGFNRRALLGKLATFEHKYKRPVKYFSKESMPVHVWTHFYYHLRYKILEEGFLQEVKDEKVSEKI